MLTCPLPLLTQQYHALLLLRIAIKVFHYVTDWYTYSHVPRSGMCNQTCCLAEAYEAILLPDLCL